MILKYCYSVRYGCKFHSSSVLLHFITHGLIILILNHFPPFSWSWLSELQILFLAKGKQKKKKKNWQKLVLNYVCQRVWNEKLKCVKIIRFYWEKGGMDLQWFGPLWWFVLFFTDISRLNHVSSQDGGRCSKENINSIQFSFLFSLHMQPINIIYLMKTNSTILRDASIHKNAFYCHHNTVLEITVWLAFGTSQVGHKP